MKFIFLIVWFCAIYPAGFFMGSFALFVVYFMDRFSLMRTWARAPYLGAQVSGMARSIFIPIAIVVMAIASSYWWSGFPFDNLCVDNATPMDTRYVGEREVTVNGTRTSYLSGLLSFSTPDYTTTVTITPDDQNYLPCSQDFRSWKSRAFPALPRYQEIEWMTEDQAKVSNIFGWFSVAILVLVVLKILSSFGKAVRSHYLGNYKPRGKDVKIPYSKCPAIDNYIPEVDSAVFAYPLLLCDISDLDTRLFNWTDPEKKHSYYGITQDAKELVEGKPLPEHLFTTVKYWRLAAEEK
jgi:hypothetical protein